MKTILLALLLVIAGWLRASIDTSNYIVYMNDGSRLRGKILELKQGDHIKLIKEDGTAQSISWDAFKDYKNADELERQAKEDELLKAEKLASKRKQQHDKLKEKMAERHKDWNRCAVMFARDTQYLRIKYKDEYSATGGFQRRAITVALDNEEERDLLPSDYTGFIVYGDTETVQYISLAKNNNNNYTLYKVILDGRCQLLYDETIRFNGGMMPMTTDMDKYFVYYNGALTKMKIEADNAPNITTGFKKRCREVFADCPLLVEKIGEAGYKANDLAPMVKEFNACIGTKGSPEVQKTQTKEYQVQHERHKDWNRCTLIANGDTQQVRIKYKDEDTTTGGFRNPKIAVAYADETERHWLPEQYTAFIVYGDTETVKYVSIPIEASGYNKLYKVVIEGKCELLYDLSIQSAGTITMLYDVDRFYTYYKGAITKVKTEGQPFNISPPFKKKCSKVFADCPTLVSKIEDQTYNSSDIRDIVNEFNRCVEDRRQ